ncbi:BON domain-containing protein [Paraburkholderia sp. BCC1884]|uniref:BON domain-containing protein n=1 Tax=Paraburkholderia sp. BCC1884 TaxID=2562668 RepID=UPI001181FF1C|nr:BON domain-containing protein [Paraburkholderia sp. BCC1884]
MRISTLAATCAVLALLSNAAIAQSTSDTAASQAAPATSKADARQHNRQLSKAVRHALHSTKGLTSSNIAVLVKGGTVSLVGTVPDSKQIDVAGDVAKRVPQVSDVDNRLIVEEEGAQ